MDDKHLGRRVESAKWVRPFAADEKPSVIAAVINGVDLDVPDDPLNADRQAIQRWQDAGNPIADPDPLPPPETMDRQEIPGS